MYRYGYCTVCHNTSTEANIDFEVPASILILDLTYNLYSHQSWRLGYLLNHMFRQQLRLHLYLPVLLPNNILKTQQQHMQQLGQLITRSVLSIRRDLCELMPSLKV